VTASIGYARAKAHIDLQGGSAMRRMLAGLAGLILGLSVSTYLSATPAADKVYIGVLVQNVTPELARSFGMDAPKGALVAAVRPDGPAAIAGIRPGDVILAFGDAPVQGFESLHALVLQTPAGVGVSVRLWRNQAETTTVVIVEPKRSENAAFEREGH
jgi:S1-C subfamily serine protease